MSRYMEIDKKYTVSELTRQIKLTLEGALAAVWVEGEISNFVRHSSGHFYFSLKDDSSQISAVMWRGKNTGMFFTPQDGMKVLAKGRVTVFEKRGSYQLDVDTLQPLGIGDLQLAFEQLKIRLSEEGLFEEKHKMPIPPIAERIGIITSPTGAAIRDLISVSKRRFPGVQLLLIPARVQGEGAAEEIAQAIEEFNEYGNIDILIVGRGGGSLEDLWAFNEEIVARAIFNSKIPVISAVGHEVDFTIADFVADRRAPTPSAAAEIAVLNADETWKKVVSNVRKLEKHTIDTIQHLHEKVQYLENSRAFQAPVDIIKQYSLQLDFLTEKLEMSSRNRIQNTKDNISQLEKRLLSLNPENVLKRGYSIVSRMKDNDIVLKSTQVHPGDRLNIRFSEGGAISTVETVK